MRQPVFVIIAVFCLLLALFTPRILLFFPLLFVVVAAVIAIGRRERGRGFAVATIVAGIGLVIIDASPFGTALPDRTANLTAAEITDWNWRTDPSFGTKGTIHWNVQVHNKSDRNIEHAKVEFTTYDRNGKIVSTTFTFVDAIPAGETRTSSSFADFYRTEDKASVTLSAVYFAN